MKSIVKIGYKDYVMSADQALTLLALLEGAEIYESKWDAASKNTSHYIYQQDTSDFIREMKILPTALYNLAKLAGKPNRT